MPSSVIAQYWYDRENGALYIRFISGLVYRYKGVPAGLYEKMRQVISKGRFFNTHIKGAFDFEQVAQP